MHYQHSNRKNLITVIDKITVFTMLLGSYRHRHAILWTMVRSRHNSIPHKPFN